MAWKKALFLGGAVLLLAACNSATAPNPLVRDGAGAAKLEADAAPSGVTLPPVNDPDCRSGYYVRSGDKDVCIEFTEIMDIM